MKSIWKIIVLFLKWFLTIFGIFLVLVWVLCGGGGVYFLIIILALIPILIIKKIWTKNNKKYFLEKNKNQEILIKYISQAKQEGLSKGQIIQNLIDEGGWDWNEVNLAYESINKK